MTVNTNEQVGLVALAMLVTKSSVTSLQARQGLPLGAQIVGWAVMSMLSARHSQYVANIPHRSFVTGDAASSRLQSEQLLSPSADDHLPDLRAGLCHPHHLLRRPVLLCLFNHSPHLGADGTSRPLANIGISSAILYASRNNRNYQNDRCKSHQRHS